MLLPKLQGPDNSEQYINLTAFDKGGMGEVYLGDDVVSGKKVSIKIIEIPKAAYEDLLMREVNVSMQLTGKNIVSTLYAGKTLFGTQEFLYLVQEYYANGNLRKRITPNIDMDVCFRMMTDLLRGLATVHDKIVHRDLKPENILLSNDGELLIADFGLAKYVEEATKTKTFKGSGTFPYMAPECWTNQSNSVAMDIYSLGIIFFEILAGQLPAKFTTPDEWRDFHLFSQVPDISNFRSDVPVKLKQIIMKMTQKRVADRFKSVDEIKEALEQAVVQAKAEKNDVERLAQLAHSTIQQITAEQLRKKEQAEKEAAYQKLLNFHITEIFEDTKRIVSEINNKLVDHKITVNETRFTGNIKARKLELTFNRKSIYFEFSSSTIFQEYEERRIMKHREHQERYYGMVMMNAGESIFKQRNIILLGNVYCNHQNPALHVNYGFNLLLVKSDADQYGKWFRASFFDTAIGSDSQRQNFALREGDFLREFELCFALHVMRVDYKELTEGDLTRAIQEILS